MFSFFVTSLILVMCYSSEVKDYLKTKYKIGEIDNSTIIPVGNLTQEEALKKAQTEADDDLRIFYTICVCFALAYVALFVQLFMTKPKSKKVILPLVLVTSITFLVLIAIDFYLEIQVAHSTFRDSYMQSKESPTDKKGKAKFKTGYLIVYGQ